MKKMSWLRICSSVLAACLLACALPGMALADNVFDASGTDSDSSANTSTVVPMGNDIMLVGNACSLSGEDVKNDLLAAGANLDIQDCSAGGSMRLAAQTITLDNCKADENITIACQDAVLSNTTGNVVAVASSTANFSGECNELTINANSVVISGTVHGNVTVNASTLTVEDGAVIEGTLSGSTSPNPGISDGAQIDSNELQTSANSSSGNGIGAPGLLGLLGFGSINPLSLLFSALGCLVVTLLCECFARNSVQGSADMMGTRPAAMIVTGILAAIAAPFVVVLLLITIVGAIFSLALLLALLVITIVGAAFMAASLGHLVFKNTGRFKASLLMALIVGLAQGLPVLGILVTVAGFMYLLGYVLQTMFLSATGKNAEPAQQDPQAQQPPQAPAGFQG